MTATATIVNDLEKLFPDRTSQPKVVVCIPAYNEETRIGRVVREASRYANPILICDDGSYDGTAREAEANGGQVIRHARNLGKGAALRTLLQEARKLSPDILVTIDGDGQHSPHDIPILLIPISDGSAEVVVGSRFGNGNSVPYYRKIGNSLLTALTNMSATTTVRDTQSGFRAYSARVIPFIDIRRDGMGVDSEILIRVARGGFRVAERNVSVNYEGETSTFNPVSHVIRVMWGLFEEFMEHNFSRFVTNLAKSLTSKSRHKKRSTQRS